MHEINTNNQLNMHKRKQNIFGGKPPLGQKTTLDIDVLLKWFYSSSRNLITYNIQMDTTSKQLYYASHKSTYFHLLEATTTNEPRPTTIGPMKKSNPHRMTLWTFICRKPPGPMSLPQLPLDSLRKKKFYTVFSWAPTPPFRVTLVS